MDQGFPGQHMTTTTTTTSSSTYQRNLRFDKSYIRTIPGYLKLAEMVLNILGFICIIVSSSEEQSRGGWFNTVAMGGFWITGFLLAFYLFHVIEKFHRIPWLKVEFIYCALWSVFYLLAASLAADYARRNEGYGVASFFGFCALAVYAYDAWLKFTGVRSGMVAQGQHESSKQVSTVTSPAY